MGKGNPRRGLSRSGVHLPSTPSGTSDSGFYDPDTGTTVPRSRPTTDDARVGPGPGVRHVGTHSARRNKRMGGVGVGGPGEPL
jgi:hypothetical protein